MGLNGLAREIFVDKYAAAGETEWEHCAKRVARHVSQAENGGQVEWQNKFFNAINDMDFIPGGRILFGAGRPRQSLLNCFALHPQDNVESLGELLKNVYLISCQGGGIGFNFSDIRPRGDSIQNIKFSAPGTVSEMKKIDAIGQEVRGGKNRRCIRKGTKILTIDGFKNIEDIIVGDLVSTNDGWREVIENIYQGKQNIMRVIHQDGYIDCTYNHKVAVLKDINGGYEWKYVKDLKLNDRLFFVRNISDGQYTTLPSYNYDKPKHSTTCRNIVIPDLDEDMAWFLGAFAGDGCVSLAKGKRFGSISVASNSDDQEYIEKLTIQMQRFGINVKKYKQKDSNCIQIISKSYQLALYFGQNFKQPNTTIQIPDCIKFAKKNIKMAYIAGVMDADGCVKNRPVRICSTVYLDFAKALQSLLYSCGIESRLKLGKRTSYRKKHWQLIHELSLINRKAKEKFYALTNNIIIKKIQIAFKPQYSNGFPGKWTSKLKLKKGVTNYNDKTQICIDTLEDCLQKEMNFVPIKVYNVIDLNETDDTYDISVINNHCFIADGILVHNSALLAILNVDHPDILDFLHAKLNLNQLNNFNISVGITSEFIKAVEKNKIWKFHFNNKIYNVYEVDRISKDGKKDIIRLTAINEADAIGRAQAGYKKDYSDKFENAREIEYKARKLWDTIIDNARQCGDPGLFNIDFVNTHTNVSYFTRMDQGNPCGEVPLEHGANCCLGSINLANMYDEKKNDVDWKKLTKIIRIGVRFLDNVLTINNYPIPLTKEAGNKSRRIGLGVMGLHYLLIRMGHKYGSEESLEFLERLFATFRNEAYLASIELAIEKGVFPKFDADQYLREEYAKNLPQRIRRRIKKYGIRNAVLLTIPPTGTTSMIAEVSSGIEPIFSPVYKRSYRDPEDPSVWKHAIVIDKLFKEFYDENKDTNHIIGAYDVTPEEHLNVQATVQRFIDSSISKTINVPEDITSDRLSSIILEFIGDLKGVTIYRQNSRGLEPLQPIEINSVSQLKRIMKQIEETSSQSSDSCKNGSCNL